MFPVFVTVTAPPSYAWPRAYPPPGSPRGSVIVFTLYVYRGVNDVVQLPIEPLLLQRSDSPPEGHAVRQRSPISSPLWSYQPFLNGSVAASAYSCEPEN